MASFSNGRISSVLNVICFLALLLIEKNVDGGQDMRIFYPDLEQPIEYTTLVLNW